MSSVVSMEAVLKSIECLPAEQKVAVLQALLLEAKPVSVKSEGSVVKEEEKKEEKAKKAKKEKDPNAPKKEGSWWAKASAEASKKLKEEGLVLKEIGLLVPEFCSLLAIKEYITKEKNASVEEIKEIFNFCKENPGVAKETLAIHKEEKAAKKPAAQAGKKETKKEVKEEVATPEAEEGYHVFEGKKYRVDGLSEGGTVEDGCFLFDGEVCAGFYLAGELDPKITM